MADALRLAVGTLTRLPIRPPGTVDRAVAGGAMILGPLVGAVLVLPLGVIAALIAVHANSTTSGLIVASITVGAIAYLTRAIHLDGLADTADALGSGRPAQEALEIARRSDIGPFGAVTLVLVLLTQVAAFAALIDDGRALLALVVAAGSARLALPLACLPRVPAARKDGLGVAVAGSVPVVAATGLLVAWSIAVASATMLFSPGSMIGALAAVIGVVAVTIVVVRTAISRFGGITGDVLGAAVELSFTAALVILVALPT